MQPQRANRESCKKLEGEPRLEFSDEILWKELAHKRNIRLPQKSTLCRPCDMERWLRKLSISMQKYSAWSGFRTLRDFPNFNPDWSLRAWVGLLLEGFGQHGDDIDREKY